MSERLTEGQYGHLRQIIANERFNAGIPPESNMAFHSERRDAVAAALTRLLELESDRAAHEETRRRLMDEEHEHALAMDQLREHELHGSVLVLRLALEQARRELAEVSAAFEKEKAANEWHARQWTLEQEKSYFLAWQERGMQLQQLASLLSCEPGAVVERVKLHENLRIAADAFLSSGYHPEHEGDFVEAVNALARPSRPASEPVEQPLHLITQRGQPYGSVRRCCERCGVAIPSINPRTSEHRWTDNENVWYADNANCRKPAPPASVAEQAQGVSVGDEFGWTTLGGARHYGRVCDIDSNVIYIKCQYHARECCTEAPSSGGDRT